MKVSVYLNFKGNCREAFDFYSNVFGTKPIAKMTYGGSGETMCDMKVDKKDEDKILHISLPLSNESNLMGCDILKPECQAKAVVGTNFHISLHPDSKDHADKLYEALTSEGGSAQMPMANQFWGDYFGMCADRFGVQWMINYSEKKDEPKDEKKAEEE
jgi:PhnB protein